MLKNIFIQSTIPTLTSSKGWFNEFWNCSYKMRPPNHKTGDPGNYAQCTNNNLDVPNNLTCPTHPWNSDYCHPRDKVSPHCYANTMRQCVKEKENQKL